MSGRPSSRAGARVEAAAIAALSATGKTLLDEARRFELDVDDREEISPGAVWLIEHERGCDPEALSTYLRSMSRRWRVKRARGGDALIEVNDESVIDVVPAIEDADGVLDVAVDSSCDDARAARCAKQARRARLSLLREARARRAGQFELNMPDDRIEGRALREAVAEQLRKPRRRAGRSKRPGPYRARVLPGQLALPL